MVLLVDVIFALIKPEADEKGVTDEDFASAIGGDEGCLAREAFMAEGQGDREDRGPWRLRDCYRLAGIVGVDPEGLTLRELVWMADGAQEERWNHTAALRADLHNPWRENPVSPMHFHPYRKRKKKTRPKPIKGNIEILKYLFVDRRDWRKG